MIQQYNPQVAINELAIAKCSTRDLIWDADFIGFFDAKYFKTKLVTNVIKGYSRI